MSLLRRVRAEWSGALRSVRYDMGRRPVEPPAGGPDMTSTGMNTFGGLMAEPPAQTPRTRMPRRAALITALGVLTVVGAAGAYLGVVNGLGSFLNAAQAGTVPSQPGTTFSPNSGIGRGPTKTKNQVKSDDVPPTPIITSAPAAGAIPKAAEKATARNVSPLRTTSPAKDECDCGSLPPPVPTPTVPQSQPVPSDSASPSAGADPSPSETSATPGDSAEPSDSPQARHRHRPH